jgi:hypothetical protein
MTVLGWRGLTRLLVAFAVWSVVASYVFPGYSRLVLPTTTAALDVVRPHGLDLVLANEYPSLRWSFTSPDIGPQEGALSFTLLAYNTVLYMCLATAFPGLTWRGRLAFVASAAPMVFLFHVIDLGLTVESRVLSVLQVEHYDFLHDFGLWFSLVKGYNFLSVMALKQVVFVGLFYLQWRWLSRWAPWARSASADGAD